MKGNTMKTEYISIEVPEIDNNGSDEIKRLEEKGFKNPRLMTEYVEDLEVFFKESVTNSIQSWVDIVQTKDYPDTLKKSFFDAFFFNGEE